MNGFVKIERKMVDWGWYDDPNTKIVFLHLLLTANCKKTEYHGHKIEAGQTIFGRKALADKLGLSERNVRTALEHLESTGEIRIESTNKYSIATVVNWAKYQFVPDEPTNNRPTTDQQVTTPKERKNNIFRPPTLGEVEAYAKEKRSPVDYEFFWNYYNESDWNGVKNWKQKFLTWDRKERERTGNRPTEERVKYDY